MTLCCVDGCHRPYMARGYCALHYRRFMKHGDPLMVQTRGYKALTFEEAWENHVDRTGDCWLWMAGRRRQGYGCIRDGGKSRLATRVAWEHLVGPIPDGLLVLHHCDNPPCVRIEHLHLGTHKQNSDEKWARGRAGGFGTMPTLNRGEGNVHAKLTEPDVVAIRAAAAAGATLDDLAVQYNVIRKSVWNVVQRRTWKHL